MPLGPSLSFANAGLTSEAAASRAAADLRVNFIFIASPFPWSSDQSWGAMDCKLSGWGLARTRLSGLAKQTAPLEEGTKAALLAKRKTVTVPLKLGRPALQTGVAA